MVIVALVAPACTVTGDCTVATEVLLLDSATVAAALGAVVSATVPWTVVPARVVVAFSVTPATVGPVGAVELEPQPEAAQARTKRAENSARRVPGKCFMVMMGVTDRSRPKPIGRSPGTVQRARRQVS